MATVQTKNNTVVSTQNGKVTVTGPNGVTIDIDVDEDGTVTTSAGISVPTSFGSASAGISVSKSGETVSVKGQVAATAGKSGIAGVTAQGSSEVTTSPDGNGGRNVTVTNSFAVTVNALGKQVDMGRVTNTQGFNVSNGQVTQTSNETTVSGVVAQGFNTISQNPTSPNGTGASGGSPAGGTSGGASGGTGGAGGENTGNGQSGGTGGSGSGGQNGPSEPDNTSTTGTVGGVAGPGGETGTGGAGPGTGVGGGSNVGSSSDPEATVGGSAGGSSGGTGGGANGSAGGGAPPPPSLPENVFMLSVSLAEDPDEDTDDGDESPGAPGGVTGAGPGTGVNGGSNVGNSSNPEAETSSSPSGNSSAGAGPGTGANGGSNTGTSADPEGSTAAGDGGGDGGGGKPIVIDLDNDGVELTDVRDSGALYDIDGDGYLEQMGWVDSDDAILVYDKDNNRKAVDHDEISFVGYVAGARTDLEGLLYFDSNEDGLLNNLDSEFSKFGVWQDLDQDGQTGAGEFRTMDEIGISSITLSSDQIERTQAGNTVYGIGEYSRKDGATGEFADTAFKLAGYDVRNADGLVEVRSDDSQSVVSLAGTVGKTFDATESNADVVAGTSGSDKISASGTDDVALFGGDGDDELLGGGGNDFFDGGNGRDIIKGGSGDDKILVDAEDLLGTIRGGDGLDSLFVKAKVDLNLNMASMEVEQLFSGAGNDIISNEGGAAGIIDSGIGDDKIYGSDNGDILIGSIGNDEIHTGSGDDVIIFGTGHGTDIVEDSGGQDEIIIAADVSEENVVFEQVGNDLVVGIRSRPEDASKSASQLLDKIIIKNGATAQTPIETIRLANGQVVSLSVVVTPTGLLTFTTSNFNQLKFWEDAANGNGIAAGHMAAALAAVAAGAVALNPELANAAEVAAHAAALGAEPAVQAATAAPVMQGVVIADLAPLPAVLDAAAASPAPTVLDLGQIPFAADASLPPNLTTAPASAAPDTSLPLPQGQAPVQVATVENIVVAEPPQEAAAPVNAPAFEASAAEIQVSADAQLQFDAPADVHDDLLLATEDTKLVFAATDLLSNDVDPEGGLLQVIAVSNAVGGTVALSDGQVVFTPDPDFNGTAGFRYTVRDEIGNLTTGNAIVQVAAVNDNPVAGAETFSATEDTTLVIAPGLLLANDADVDGDTLSISSVQNAVGGMVSLDGSGNVVFIPDANFNGTASFQYTASDGQGGTATATATLLVAAVNDAPIVTAELLSGVEDVTLLISPASLLANDSDVDGDTLTISAVGNAVGGTVALDGNGDIVFTPTPNHNGAATFQYAVDDGQGGVTWATAAIAISAVNDAPTALGEALATNEDVSLIMPVASLLSNDSDIEGNPLSISAVGNSVGGSVSLSGGNVVFTPAANFNGAASFEYTVSDGQGGSTTVTAAVAVAAVNDAPATNTDYFSMNEDSSLSISVASLMSNDSDVEGNTLTVVGVHSPANGSVSLSGGTITFTPNPDFYGSAGFYYTVSDGQGGTTNGYASVSVADTYDAPPPSGDPGPGDPGDPVNGGGDPDPDPGKPVLLDLNNNGLEIVTLDESTAYFDINADGYRDRMSWIGAEDGLLAYDKNQDNAITQRDEIAFVDYLDGARTDLEGLRAFDSNKNGVLDAQDAEWSKFGVWQDANQDGVSDSGEFRSLDQVGIVGINLTSDWNTREQAGSIVFGQAEYYRTDGSSGVAGDVQLSFQSGAPGASPPTSIEAQLATLKSMMASFTAGLEPVPSTAPADSNAGLTTLVAAAEEEERAAGE